LLPRIFIQLYKTVTIQCITKSKSSNSDENTTNTAVIYLYNTTVTT